MGSIKTNSQQTINRSRREPAKPDTYRLDMQKLQLQIGQLYAIFVCLQLFLAMFPESAKLLFE